ncbi:HK97 gp10 family phage protein [Mangrovihabitans endophyticus]|uniref:Phage protein, HK97 gp10 family n=1 Tax=Mangrovihabitans endophyticus TaxID=1751298 RepID=A0A8J3BXJ3_9ACTN|nr:HK97 gp10 family phage protein [Mangrovihabitans endophyticus]GGK89177.1 hypothetical protein GCM10012284_23990 [Mangrovihabitans endophyticus]
MKPIRIRGERQLAAKLARVPGALEAAARRAVAAEVHETAQDERGFAPVDTGALEASITEEVDGDGLSGRTAATERYATAVELGTEDTAAQPYAEPAAKLARHRFPKTVVRELNEELRRVAG